MHDSQVFADLLDEAEQQTNHTISRMRKRVEPIFAFMAQMGATCVEASD